MNKYREHIYIIPEDDADRQIVNGFVDHPAVNEQRVQVMPPAGGWLSVLETFEKEYVPKLRKSLPLGYVVLVVDFDGHETERRSLFATHIPEEIRDHVFLVGAKSNPETLRNQLNQKLPNIGSLLAEECNQQTDINWSHPQLVHNASERKRLVDRIRPILFQ